MIKGTSAGQTLLIAGGSVLGQGIVVLITPLLTRTYGAGEFAFLAVYTAVSLILGPAIVLRMDTALGLPKGDHDGAAVAWVGIGSALLLSIILVVVGAIWGGDIGRLLHSPPFGESYWLVAVGIFVLALDQVSLGWMVRKKQYSAIAFRNLFAGIAQAAAQIAFGYLHVPNGLVLGLVVGRVVAVGGVLGSGGLLKQPLPGILQIRRVAWRYRRFIYVSSWSTLINGVGVQAPVLVISACYGKTGVGELGLAIRVLSAPLAIVGLAVGRVFQGHIAESIRVDRADIRNRLRRTAVLLVATGLVPTLVLVVFGPGLFEVIFGGEWRTAGVLAAVLAVGLYAQFIVSPVSTIPTLLEHQALQIRWDVVRMIVTIAAPLVAYRCGADIVVATLTLGITFAVMYASFYVMSDRLAAGGDRAIRAAEAR